MIIKLFLIAALYAFAFAYPLQEGCECGCCCSQIPQQDPATTTTAPDEASCCDCCSPPFQDDPPLTTTSPASDCGCECCCSQIPQEDPTTTTTTTVAADEPSCCNCCSPPLQDNPPMTTTTPAPESHLKPCDNSCCEESQQGPPATTTESSCCCGGQQLFRALPDELLPLDYVFRRFKGPRMLKCPPGYKRIHESCYYVETAKLTFYEATMNCMELGGHLFVPQDITEWHNVMAIAPRDFWTWTGLVQKGYFLDPEWHTEEKFINFTYVNWLIKPFTPEENGWSILAQCAAYYNIGVDVLSYVYFYSCSLPFHSICETHFLH